MSRWKDRFDISYLFAFLGEATLALTFVLYVWIARAFGPELYGLFNSAAALAGILGVFVQFGLPIFLTRLVAGDPEKGPGAFGSFVLLQSCNLLITLLLVWAASPWLRNQGTDLFFVFVLLAAEFFRGVKMLLRSVLKGRSWFAAESGSVAGERLFVLLVSGATLLLTQDLSAVLVAFGAARLAEILLTGFLISRKVTLLHRPGAAELKEAYHKGLPFAVHGLLWILYYQVDMVMLQLMSEEVEVGYYGAAYRVLEMFSALPRVVFHVAFTRFAVCVARNPAELPRKALEAFRVLILLAVPALVVASSIQQPGMLLIYGGEYRPAILLMAILLPTLGIKLFSCLAEELLLASHHEKKLPGLLFWVALSNIALNFLLIPRVGAAGAAIATLLSEAVFCGIGLCLLFRHVIPAARKSLIRLLVPVIGLCATPSLCLLGLPLPAALAIGGLCLFLLVFLLRSRILFQDFPDSSPSDS